MSKEEGQKEFGRIHSNGWRNVSEFRKGNTTISGIPTTTQSFPMIVLSWNMRGINSRLKKGYLQEILKVERPHVVLLQETKVSGEILEETLMFLKPKYEVVSSDARGSVGGISILWNPTKIRVEGWT